MFPYSNELPKDIYDLCEKDIAVYSPWSKKKCPICGERIRLKSRLREKVCRKDNHYRLYLSVGGNIKAVSLKFDMMDVLVNIDQNSTTFMNKDSTVNKRIDEALHPNDVRRYVKAWTVV